jgi:hypothetical protein
MKTSRSERDALISAATTAHRARDAEGRPVASSAWMDLDADGRLEAFDATARQRAIEAASDGEGLSSTARAVLASIRQSR